MKLFFCIFTLFCSLGWTAEETAKATSINTTGKIKAKSKSKKNYYQMEMQYLIWQENINATSGAIAGSLPFQFTGLKMGVSYNHTMSKARWVQNYAADFSFGTTKGGSTTSALTDEFKNQLWFGLSLTPGLTYRTTGVSDLSLILPLTYRKVNWAYGETLPIQLDRGSSFSVGLGARFALRFTPKSALFASLVHQQMWKATQWSLGWQYEFK